MHARRARSITAPERITDHNERDILTASIVQDLLGLRLDEIPVRFDYFPLVEFLLRYIQYPHNVARVFHRLQWNTKRSLPTESKDV
jgi:hypothetical protein